MARGSRLRSLVSSAASVFHYALLPEGYLWLGPVESIEAGDAFALLDRRWKVYQRRPGPTPSFALGPGSREAMPMVRAAGARRSPPGVREVTEQALLQAYAPAEIGRAHV